MERTRVYTHEAVEAFLEFCLANGCEVNALIFHVNDDTPEGLLAHPAAVMDARRSFLENPRYAPLKITRILTNEMGGPFYTRQPAGTLARYAAFEESGADAGARSCWFDSGGIAECHNGTLDGLLTHGSFQPRSVFWVHTLYAARVATRVASSVSSDSLVALASRGEGSDPPQVLVGHVDFWRALNRQPATLATRLVLDNVRANPDFLRAGRVTVRVESIPDTGEAPLAAPLLLSSAPADIVTGTVSIDLPPMAVGQVLRVTLLPLDGGVPDSPLAFTANATGQIVSLQWSARPDGPPATGYLLEVGSAPDTADLLALPLGNVTRFESAAPSGVYHLRLRATNAAGAGAPTASQRVEVGCLAPPGRPRALRGTVTGPVVALTWQRGAGAVDRYVLEAGQAPGLSNLASLVIPAQSTAFQAEAPPGTYFLRVRAANDCGLSGPSAEIFLVVGADAALPGEPGTPTAAVGGSTVSLGWAAPASGGTSTGYRLEAGTQPALADIAVVTLAATPAFVTSGVPPGTYYVRVRGINQAGVGPPSGDAAVVVR